VEEGVEELPEEEESEPVEELPEEESEPVEELPEEESEPEKKRRAVRRRKKVEPKKGDGELEPFDLKSYFIPKDRNWVLPVFVVIVLLLFGYYMVVFMGVVSETCDAQANIGDDDCDGYVDNPETSSDDSASDDSDSNNNSTSESSEGNGTDGS
jgi:hypothetical protein